MFDHQMLDRLYRYCCSLCLQQSDAYDLLQTGIERCLKAPPSSNKATYSYTIRIIRNAYIDEFRRNSRHTHEEFDETTHMIDYDITSLEQLMIDRSELVHFWAKLSDTERETLFLWAVEGYSLTEVADHLEKPKNTILSIIYRMRKRLETEKHLTTDKGEVA